MFPGHLHVMSITSHHVHVVSMSCCRIHGSVQCRRGHMAATFDVAGAVGAAHVAGYGAAWRRAAAWLVGDVGESCCQIQPLAATPLDPGTSWSSCACGKPPNKPTMAILGMVIRGWIWIQTWKQRWKSKRHEKMKPETKRRVFFVFSFFFSFLVFLGIWHCFLRKVRVSDWYEVVIWQCFLIKVRVSDWFELNADQTIYIWGKA